MRSAGATNPGVPSFVTRATNSMMDCLALPSFQDGRGSAAPAQAVVRATAPTSPVARRRHLRLPIGSPSGGGCRSGQRGVGAGRRAPAPHSFPSGGLPGIAAPDTRAVVCHVPPRKRTRALHGPRPSAESGEPSASPHRRRGRRERQSMTRSSRVTSSCSNSIGFEGLRRHARRVSGAVTARSESAASTAEPIDHGGTLRRGARHRRQRDGCRWGRSILLPLGLFGWIVFLNRGDASDTGPRHPDNLRRRRGHLTLNPPEWRRA